MNILFVSCLLPYPNVAHGGGVDLFRLIESLSARHEIHLVSIVNEAEIGHVAQLKRYCVSVQTVVPSWTWKQKLRQAWKGLWANPLMLGRRARTEMRTHIRRTVAEFEIDVVQFEWTETGNYVSAVPPGPVVTILDEVDVGYRPVTYLLEHGSRSWMRPFAQWRSRRVHQRELALLRRFDAVLTRSEHDRQMLIAQLPNSRIEVLQPWTHAAEFAEITEGQRQRGRLLFVGAMDRDENCEAALFFYHHIFPLVRQECPGVEFWIVGASPQERVERLGRNPAVRVTGYVEDLRAAYAGCDVFVAPMRVPGGVFNKIIDAMAAGRPVVTTSLGNEGVAAPEGEAVCVSDDPVQFAKKTVALLREETFWRQIARGGRRHVQSIYHWDTNVAELESLYDRLVVLSGNRQAGNRLNTANFSQEKRLEP